MWSSKAPAALRAMGSLVLVGVLCACTVEPLASSQSNGAIGTSVSSSTSDIMAATSVAPVDTRVAQQVRNELLFAMNGGNQKAGGRYSVKLDVKETARALSVETSSLSPTSAQVAVLVNYQLIDSTTGKVVKQGKRRALAGYDRTPQSFSNERAQRDAENRAAKDVAQQVRLALAQTISNL